LKQFAELWSASDRMPAVKPNTTIRLTQLLRPYSPDDF
jgi:hypothetical protein